MIDPMMFLLQAAVARVASPSEREEAEQLRQDQVRAERNEARARAAAIGRVV